MLKKRKRSIKQRLAYKPKLKKTAAASKKKLSQIAAIIAVR